MKLRPTVVGRTYESRLALAHARFALLFALQVRDSLRMYNTLVEKCFKECVQGFRSKDLDTTEERCVQNCCNKYMKGSARVGQRFGELSAEAEQQMQAMMGQQK